MLILTISALSWYLIGLLAMLIGCRFSFNSIRENKMLVLAGSLFGPIIFTFLILDFLVDSIRKNPQ